MGNEPVVGQIVPGTADVGVGIATAPAGDVDLEELTRPLLAALAKIAGLDTTYLTVFDWDRREQEVRFVHCAGGVEIEERSRLPLPPEVVQESLPGVTRSPPRMPSSHPDSQAARRLGLQTYVSVPVVLAKHELFGMVCGASRQTGAVSEPVVSVMEFVADIVADHITRERVAATEQRAARAEEQLRTRARYLAVAEHQLKTPLTSLIGAAKLLRDGWRVLDDAQREQFIDMVVRSGDDLSDRIDGMLTEASADVRSRKLVPVDLDLCELVEAITRATDGLTTDHSVRSQVEGDLQVCADPVALHQVLGHLLDNAIKYSPRHAAVNVLASSIPGGVAISVVDEGVGLPDGMDVFEAFKRGNESLVGATPGIGLGLHIVRNLVEAMGGTVTAEANPWRGSTFTVRLPHHNPSTYASVPGTESGTTA
jgi:signal transduction histidine kinase